jgi:hypothetical protein
MRRSLGLDIGLVALGVVAAVTAGCGGGSSSRRRGSTQGNVIALTTQNNLVRFNASTPGEVSSKRKISGLQSGEQVLGIDFRPATGDLYALGSTGRLYIIDVNSGRATRVGSSTVAISGSEIGFDFNPTVDRIRVVTDSGSNFRINPNDGTLVGAGDTTLNGLTNSSLVGSAYDRNFAGAFSTTLFGITDDATPLVVLQGGVNGTPSPDGGLLTSIGGLGVNTSIGLVGFDIGPGGEAYASVAGPPSGTESFFYSVNLGTGAAQPIGLINVDELVRDIAVVLPRPTIFAITETNELVRFRPTSSGTIPVTVVGEVRGLQLNEQILGIDFRPATDQLFGLGDTERLYVISPVTADASDLAAFTFPVGQMQGIDFGFDFNPTVDRIRVINDAGSNFRLNPNTGGNVAGPGPGAGDGLINGIANATVVGAAYTNNFDRAVGTELLVIDSTNDLLAFQNPPNNGTITSRGPLAQVGGGNVDTGESVGFDISPQGGAFVVLQVGNVPTLYVINTATGALRLYGTLQSPNVRGIAISLK